MQRDKQATMERLVDAVGEIITTGGFQQVGINQVAKAAGVDKVLIYRYFGGLEGLIKAFIERQDYFNLVWKTLDNKKIPLKTMEDVKAFGKRIHINQLRYLLQNKIYQEIILWELTGKNEITDAIAAERERQGMSMLGKIAELVDPEKLDVPAISSLLIGGIYFLVLRSRTVDVFNGIELNSRQGWLRIENALSDLMDILIKDEFHNLES